jgi:hypothetical protein
MREIYNTFAQLAAVIMILITLAVSTAIFGQWLGSDTERAHDSQPTIVSSVK